MLQCCAERVQHQLPNTRKRIKWILDNVDCEYSDIRAELSSIRVDDTPDGLRNDFKSVVALLLPTDPVPKKIKEKRSLAEISAISQRKIKQVGATSQGKKMEIKVGSKVGT